MKKRKNKINSYLVGENELNKVKTHKSDILGYSKRDKNLYGVLHPLKSCLNKGNYRNVGNKTAYKLNKGTFSNKVFII